MFHAAIIPVIYLKLDPASPESISCVQDVEKVKQALTYIPEKKDILSLSFLVVLNRLCSLSTQANSDEGGLHPVRKLTIVGPGDLRIPSTNIFGNDELELLEDDTLRFQPERDFSELVRCNSASHE